MAPRNNTIHDGVRGMGPRLPLFDPNYHWPRTNSMVCRRPVCNQTVAGAAGVSGQYFLSAQRPAPFACRFGFVRCDVEKLLCFVRQAKEEIRCVTPCGYIFCGRWGKMFRPESRASGDLPEGHHCLEHAGRQGRLCRRPI